MFEKVGALNKIDKKCATIEVSIQQFHETFSITQQFSPTHQITLWIVNQNIPFRQTIKRQKWQEANMDKRDEHRQLRIVMV